MTAPLQAAGTAPVLVLVAEVTLLVLATGLVTRALRRRSAAARHFLWVLTLAGSLGLAALAPVPRGWTWRAPAWVPASTASASRPVPIAVTSATASAPVQDAAAVTTVSSPATRAPFHFPPATALRLVWALWLAGVALVVTWFIAGHALLARLARRSRPADPEWSALATRLASRSGLAHPIDLRISDVVGTPLVCGLFRPIVLLPSDAEAWPASRRSAVLLHELAHIARGDVMVQRLAWAACALYWFHPGVWLAARRLRAESERACDDRVLACGVAASDYASELLDVARRARDLRLAGAVAIAMARRSTLEGRLLSLLDDTLGRGAPRPQARWAGVAGLLVLVAAAGLARPVARAEAQSTASAQVSQPGSTSAGEPLAASTSRDADESEDLRYDATLESSDGGSLRLDLDTGADITIEGWNEPRLEIHGQRGGADAREVVLNLTHTGREATFSATPRREKNNFSSSNRFTIRVPRRFDVHIESAGGDLSITGVSGRFIGTTGGGNIDLRNVSGRAKLSTGGGDVNVSDSQLDGRVTTGGGTVKVVNVKGDFHGSSGSGPVIESDGPTMVNGGVHGHGDAQARAMAEVGAIRMHKSGGPIDVGDAPDGITATTGGGDVHVGRSGGLVDVSTGGGDVTVGPATGSVRAGTGAGDVRVQLAPGDAGRTVVVTSGTGMVIIEVPRDVTADFDLETSYTKESSPSRIRSDIPVDIQVADDWDSREGTPRKYVRATASSGADASVRVRVKTVNGDIVIKRP